MNLMKIINFFLIELICYDFNTLIKLKIKLTLNYTNLTYIIIFFSSNTIKTIIYVRAIY